MLWRALLYAAGRAEHSLADAPANGINTISTLYRHTPTKVVSFTVRRLNDQGFPPRTSFRATSDWRPRLGTVEWCLRGPPACYATRRPPHGQQTKGPAREPRAKKLRSRTPGKLRHHEAPLFEDPPTPMNHPPSPPPRSHRRKRAARCRRHSVNNPPRVFFFWPEFSATLRCLRSYSSPHPLSTRPTALLHGCALRAPPCA